MNKINLPTADPNNTSTKITNLINNNTTKILRISTKTKQNINTILNTIIKQIPTPTNNPNTPPHTLIFNSSYNQYHNIITFIHIINNIFHPHKNLHTITLNTHFKTQKINFISPNIHPIQKLHTNKINYIITKLKNISKLHINNTLTHNHNKTNKPLPKYKKIKPIIFTKLFPTNSNNYPKLHNTLKKLKLNNTTLFYKPKTSQTLNFNFHYNFLNLLHIKIIHKQLKHKFNLNLLITTPNITYHIHTINKKK